MSKRLSRISKEELSHRKEIIKNIASSYHYTKDFRNDHPCECKYAVKYKFYAEITQHMVKVTGKTQRTNYTFAEINRIAKQFKTRNEFKKNGSKYHEVARKMGWLDECCKHMIFRIRSIPQKMCKIILDKLFVANGLFDTRKIIPPQELDIYYPDFKIAFEYQGMKWHSKLEIQIRDEQKQERCKEKGIEIFYIYETDLSHAKRENDIKNQIKECLPKINSLTNKNITEEMVDAVSISSAEIYSENVLDLNTIHSLIIQYPTTDAFQKANSWKYETIRRMGRMDLFNCIKKKYIKYNWSDMTDDDMISFIISSFSTFNDLYKNEACRRAVSRRKLCEKIKAAFINKNTDKQKLSV